MNHEKFAIQQSSGLILKENARKFIRQFDNAATKLRLPRDGKHLTFEFTDGKYTFTKFDEFFYKLEILKTVARS